jgi:heptosyltransferase-2
VTDIVARAPNHLGDGVMALPALQALASLGRLTIHAPGWGTDLYRGVDARVVPRGPVQGGQVAVLFPPSFRAAWEARRVPRRVGVAADGRRWLLTDVVERGLHRRDTYAALAGAVGAEVNGPPVWHPRSGDPAVRVPEGHIGLNAVTPSGETVAWRGFADLARRMDRPVVFYGGPREAMAVDSVAGDHPRRVGLALPAFASALARCAVFVSNDSGAAHFARACGVPTVVVHGSTSPARTGPHGASAVEGEAACRPCYRKACRFGLECLQIEVDRVEAAVREVLGG